jgi:salicylate hydroxylase
VQREAADQAQARPYHMAGPPAFARDIGMRALGPERLLRRYDWIYGA